MNPEAKQQYEKPELIEFSPWRNVVFGGGGGEQGSVEACTVDADIGE